MPEVEDQRREVGGQCASIWGQRVVLKEGFSGPCSWMMWACETAVGKVGESLSVSVLKRWARNSFWLELLFGCVGELSNRYGSKFFVM